MELINAAIGQAESVVAAGRARAKSIELISESLTSVSVILKVFSSFKKLTFPCLLVHRKTAKMQQV